MIWPFGTKSAPVPVDLADRVLNNVMDQLPKLPHFDVVKSMHQVCVALGAHHPLIEAAATETFVSIFKRIPLHYRFSHEEFLVQYRVWKADPTLETASAAVPLYEVMDTGRAILDVMGPFCYGPIVQEGLLPQIRKQIFENEAAANGISVYERRRKKIPLAHERKEEPGDLAKLYLRDTPFLRLFTTSTPFTIPRDQWKYHAVILGPTGWGKSELTGLYLREALEDPEPRAIFLLDPHGDLMKKAMPRIPADRLVVIDPDTSPPDLNILDYGVLSERAALDTFKFLMSSLAGGLSPKQMACIGPLFGLLKNIEGASLVTLHEIITEQVKTWSKSAFAEPISRLPNIHRKLFENLFYSGNFGDTKDALQWKLDAALGEPAFEKMFSAKRNSIDMWKLVEDRKVVLIKGGETALGKEGMRLFLLFIIGQYYAVGKRREALPEKDRHLAMMFVDEASHVLSSPMISDILIELRKYHCAFIAASQLWEHIGKEVRPAVLGSTGTKIVGELGHAEASALAHDMHTSVETIKDLKAVKASHAQWCYYIQHVTDRAVVVTVPYGVLEGMPKLTTNSPQQAQTDQVPRANDNNLPPSTQEVSDIELAVTTARRLETSLKAHYDATGLGLHELITSAQDKLTPRLVYCGRYVANERNKVVHRDDFSLTDRVRFVRYALELESYLPKTHEGPSKPEPSHVDATIPTARRDDPPIIPSNPQQTGDPAIDTEKKWQNE